MTHELVLAGCTPTPLANYLKSLGVLRLLSTKYPDTRGYWRADQFVLRTILDLEELERFFLYEYMPTPIMAPWNGGSGFYEKDNKVALNSIMESTNERLSEYRVCLTLAEQALAGMDRSASPKGTDKASLLTRIRALLPDNAIGWFDASVSLSGDSAQYPPLLGTGGNDGRLDFTNNFMQRLLDVLPDGETAIAISRQWLGMALFSNAAPGLVDRAIGQFSPGQAGGPNGSTGFEADARINPWDFVLMIEGALIFAASTVRRNADDPNGVLSYPFTVRAVGAGAGNLGSGDSVNARGELWMPLWAQPATYSEVQSLMADGRIALGKKPAKDALDFVRAVHHLGSYRGIQSFQRFGLLMRSGKAFLATPLSRIETSAEPTSSVLDDLDQHQWLEAFRRFTQGDNTANKLRSLRKQLEDRLFDLSGRELRPGEAQSLLELLGEIQTALSISKKAKEDVLPIPRLSEQWVAAADDGTPAFRIAKALAGLRGVRDEPLPLRVQWFPLDRMQHYQHDQWLKPAAREKFRLHTGYKGRLVETMRTLLDRRLWLAEKLDMQDKPLSSTAGVTLDDIAAFLRDDRMDARIAALLPGLCLCEIPQDSNHAAGEGMAPAAFGLFKLVLTPDRTLQSLGLLGEQERLPVPLGLLAQLSTGNFANRATATAWRRLHASGLAPTFARNSLPSLQGIDPLRAAAALLIPLRYGATAVLAKRLLKTPAPETVRDPV
jgi:CRISPR-associated protein Csx17